MPQVETVELDFCCPECHCTEWYLIDNDDSLYGCARCDYVCSFDLDQEDETELFGEDYEY